MPQGRLKRFLGPAALLLLAADVELPFLNDRIPRDSGVHMTAAVEILRGRVLYRDLWENRPPGIHYVNALTFALFGATLPVIRAANVAMLFVNALVFSVLARRFMARRAVWPVTLLFLLYLGGRANRDECDAIELYMVLPMMVAAGCGLRFLDGRKWPWAVAAGAAGGLAVLFKQPGAAAGVAVALAVAWANAGEKRGGLRTLRAWGLMAAGGLAVAVVPLLYFAAHGALGDMWDCVWTYNALYTGDVGLTDRLGVMAFGFTRVGSALLLWLGCAGIAVGVVWSRRATPGPRREGLAHWVLLGLWAALDLAAVCYPGFRNPHYFMQLAPSWTLLMGAWVSRVWFTRREGSTARKVGCLLVLLVAAAGLLNAVLHQSRAARDAIQRRMREHKFTLNEAFAFYVGRRTNPDEAICLWGAEPVVYFEARRPVASRYFFTYPLQMPGYDNATRVEQFLEDLDRTRPVYVIDLSLESEYAAPLLGSKPLGPRFSYDRFGPIRDYVAKRYVRVESITKAPVFVRRDLAKRGPLRPLEAEWESSR